jgi:hypothetical protein
MASFANEKDSADSANYNFVDPKNNLLSEIDRIRSRTCILLAQSESTIYTNIAIKNSMLSKYIAGVNIYELLLSSFIELRYKHTGLYRILDVLQHELSEISKDNETFVFFLKDKIRKWPITYNIGFKLIDLIGTNLGTRICNAVKGIVNIINTQILHKDGRVDLNLVEKETIFQLSTLFSERDPDNNIVFAIKAYKEIIKFVFLQFVSGFYVKIHCLLDYNVILEVLTALLRNVSTVPGKQTIANVILQRFQVQQIIDRYNSQIKRDILDPYQKIISDNDARFHDSRETINKPEVVVSGSLLDDAINNHCYVAEIFVTSEINQLNTKLEYLLTASGAKPKTVQNIHSVISIAEYTLFQNKDIFKELFGQQIGSFGFKTDILGGLLKTGLENIAPKELLDNVVGQWGLLLPPHNAGEEYKEIEWYKQITDVTGCEELSNDAQKYKSVWSEKDGKMIMGDYRIDKDNSKPHGYGPSPQPKQIVGCTKLTLNGYIRDTNKYKYYSCSDIYSFLPKLLIEDDAWFDTYNPKPAEKPVFKKVGEKVGRVWKALEKATFAMGQGDSMGQSDSEISEEEVGVVPDEVTHTRDYFNQPDTARMIISIVNSVDYIYCTNKRKQDGFDMRGNKTIKIGSLNTLLDNGGLSEIYDIYQIFEKNVVDIINSDDSYLGPMFKREKIEGLLQTIRNNNQSIGGVRLLIEQTLKIEVCPKNKCHIKVFLSYDPNCNEFIVPRYRFLLPNQYTNANSDNFLMYNKKGSVLIKKTEGIFTTTVKGIEKIAKNAIIAASMTGNAPRRNSMFSGLSGLSRKDDKKKGVEPKPPDASVPQPERRGSQGSARTTRRSSRISANRSNTKDSWDKSDNAATPAAGGGKRRKTKRKNHKSKKLQKRCAKNKTRKRH